MNVMLLLEMARDGFGDRVAVGDRSTGMTYRQVFAASGAVAGRFTEMEVSHVGYLDVSTESLPIALFGSAWAGLPFVPLNYRLDDAALARLIGRIAPAVVVCDPSRYQSVESAPGVQSLDVSLLPGGQSGVAPAEWSYDGEAAAIVLFTSGTSGEPKAAVLRHRHLVSYVMSSTEFMSASDDEATLVSVPPYHIAGVAAILTSVYAGRRMVQLPRFDADAWIDLVVDQSVTHAMVVPTMLARINERLADRDISLETLRALSYGGGKMPRAVIETALDLLPGTDFVNAYGLTETSSTISILGPDDHRAARHGDDEAARRRLGSVGRPLPSIEIEIRDREGVVVEAGSAGEIWVRGDQVAGEYVESGPGRETDGWFATRDEGWLPLRDRKARRRDHSGRREHLPGRDRGCAPESPRSGLGRLCRGPGRSLGRGGGRGRGSVRRCACLRCGAAHSRA
jgi:acyl-CoA synthetase (AMP-forming)/AMP-acid ligase II